MTPALFVIRRSTPTVALFPLDLFVEPCQSDTGKVAAEALRLPAPTDQIGETPMEDEFMQAAITEARAGLAEGGIPIGSVLVLDGRIAGRGHNRRIQRASPILHAEMDCFENAGRLAAADYRRATLYSTLSPCDMCSGTALLYRVPRIVIGENRTFRGPEDYLRSRGVELEIVDSAACRELMETFIADRPDLWNEDIGV